MAGNDGSERCDASPSCMAGEIAPDYFDQLGVDPEQARDVARWQQGRACGTERRAPGAERGGARRRRGRVVGPPARPFADQFGDMRDRVFSAYRPIKSELDLRSLRADLHATGARIAQPLFEIKQAPLICRRWTPETHMVRGVWNIPVPPPAAEVVKPDAMLAALVGWDREGFRLGYGYDYFDRTLAHLAPRHFVIGIGLQAVKLATMYPQPHDVPLDAIVNEDGVQVMRLAEQQEPAQRTLDVTERKSWL